MLSYCKLTKWTMARSNFTRIMVLNTKKWSTMISGWSAAIYGKEWSKNWAAISIEITKDEVLAVSNMYVCLWMVDKELTSHWKRRSCCLVVSQPAWDILARFGVLSLRLASWMPSGNDSDWRHLNLACLQMGGCTTMKAPTLCAHCVVFLDFKISWSKHYNNLCLFLTSQS